VFWRDDRRGGRPVRGQKLSDSCHQTGKDDRIDRLDEVDVDPRIGRAPSVSVGPVSGDGHHERLLAAGLSAESKGHLPAVHPGQTDIQEDHVGHLLGRRPECVGTARGDPDPVSAQGQQLGRRSGRVIQVLDDEDEQRG
jgi:hypothetical protein